MFDEHGLRHSGVAVGFLALGALLLLIDLVWPSAVGYVALAAVVVIGGLAAGEDARRRSIGI